MLMHFRGQINLKLQDKIKNYIIEKQNQEGGWPLYFDGESNLSTSVKAYFALKLSGQDVSSEIMIKAKKLILKMGGAENSNVFTKIALAWSSLGIQSPTCLLKLLIFPKWFPFNIYKISYWSRTVLVPLLIMMYKKPQANNPNCISIDEIFKKRKIYSVRSRKN